MTFTATRIRNPRQITFPPVSDIFSGVLHWIKGYWEILEESDQVVIECHRKTCSRGTAWLMARGDPCPPTWGLIWLFLLSSSRTRNALIFQQRGALMKFVKVCNVQLPLLLKEALRLKLSKVDGRFRKCGLQNKRHTAPPSPIYLILFWMISLWTWWQSRSGHSKREFWLLGVFFLPSLHILEGLKGLFNSVQAKKGSWQKK
jgi:hypothetical protein